MIDDNSMFGARGIPDTKPKIADTLVKRMEQKKWGTNTPKESEVPIDWEHVEGLCSLFCTKQEIADFLKIHVNTLDYRVITDGLADSWADYYGRATIKGKLTVRHKQFQLAKEGDRAMLIWLGKQYLGQMDTKQIVASMQNNMVEVQPTPHDLSKLSTDDLLKMQEILSGAEVDPIST